MKKNLTSPLIFCFLLTWGISLFAGELTTPALSKIYETMQLREGAPNFFNKIQNTSEPLTIAYLGGSITAGAGASQEAFCYRSRVTAALKEQLPGREIREVNAALGGTGSFLGAFRVEQDCISHHPDLVLVEFAVNDGGETEKHCIAYMEGIVRQIWTTYPQTDILFIYTTVVGWFDGYKKNVLPTSIRAHEKVAAHYGIPSINVGQVAAWMVNDNHWQLDDFSKDGVHPKDDAYKVYADVIIACGQEAFRQTNTLSVPANRTPLRPSLSANPLEPGRMIPASQAQLSAEWKTGIKSPSGYFPSVIESDVPGATITLKFTGSYLAFFDALGPDSGTIEYNIDEGEWQQLQNFDQWAKDYYRSHCHKLTEGLEHTKLHTLHLRIAEVQPKDSKGRFFRPGYFLVASPKPALPAAEIMKKAKPLFPHNGEPVGWRVSAWHDVSAPAPEEAKWIVKDNELHGSDPRGTWLVSEKEYGDFYIEFEFLLPRRGNSGFGVHFPDKGDPAFDGMEIQMCDPRYYTESGYGYNPGELTGCIYEALLPRVNMFFPEKWNKYQITCQGDNIWIVLNGETVVKTNLAAQTRKLDRGTPLSERPRRGHLGFQELSRGGDHVVIRNIKMTELE